MAELTAFIEATDNIVAFDAKFKADLHSEASLLIVLEKLEDLWDAVEATYSAFRQSVQTDSPSASSTKASVQDKYTTVFSTYALLKGQIQTTLSSYRPATEKAPLNQHLGPCNTVPKPSVPSSGDPTPPPLVSEDRLVDSLLGHEPLFSRLYESTPLADECLHSLPLPPCDIETFHGDFSSWPSFRDLFTAVVIRNRRLSKVEKLFHLLHKTKGEAKEIVSRFPLTNQSFELAWQQLTAVYENKRVLMNNQLKILFSLPIVFEETASSIKSLLRGINSCLHNLQMHSIPTDNWDPILVFLCCQRLPSTTITFWEQSLTNSTSIPTWTAMHTFLTSRILTLDSIAETRTLSLGSKPVPLPSSSKAVKAHHLQSDSPRRTHSSSQPREVIRTCPMCPREKHNIRGCSKFRAMTLRERCAIVEKYKLCSNCLSSGHQLPNCQSVVNCAVCRQRHHTWLHEHTPPAPCTSEAPSEPNVSASTSTAELQLPDATVSPRMVLHHQQARYISRLIPAGHRTVLLGTANLMLHHLGSVYPVRALLDSGSEISFISASLRNRLQLPLKPGHTSVMGVNGQLAANTAHLCEILLSPTNNHSLQIKCSAFVLPSITGNLPALSVDWLEEQSLPNIPLADEYFYQSSTVDMLIGADLYPDILRKGVQLNVLGSLCAQETIFGWVLTGTLPSNQTRSHTARVHLSTASLNDQLQKFWEIEEVPKKRHLSPADKYCEELFRSTTKRNAEGKFVVQLPFKQDYPESEALGLSRQTVATIFRRNESALLKKPEFKVVYDGVLSEYLTLGHMVKASSDPTSVSPCFYLPHHPVIKPESTTTDVRVVFNASHVTSNGRSLNDVLHPGPALQADLMTLLLKWRLPKFVFSSDITKMYRQILIEPRQRRYQRLLFRATPQENVQDYELNTVTFGVNCAPFLAIRTLLQLAEDVKSTHPLASKILRKNMYVDDVLAGYDDVATALKARDEIISALNSAGFQLRKWTANDKLLLAGLPSDHLLSGDFLQFEETSSSKALGVRWNAVRDEFYFTIQSIPRNPTFTKREVLSIIARLFDPAGWLAPIIVTAKIIMQQVWLDNTDWDETLKTGTLNRWKDFVDNYVMVSQVKIPRWVGLTNQATIQLHGFCDASEKAYAGVLYVRCESTVGVTCHLLAAKTRVAPVKTLSLPRLELCGALLLAQMLEQILATLSLPRHELHCWTDSTIVLAWIQKPPCVWQTFVANRVAKIQDIVGVSCFRHVDGKTNPADLGSRGTISPEFVGNPLWWNGPDWLCLEETAWPGNDLSDLVTDAEIKPVRTHLITSPSGIEEVLARFSSFARMLRVMSYALRFVAASRLKQRAVSTQLTSFEIKTTKTKLIHLIQVSSFPNDYHNLLNRQPIHAKSHLLPLNPILDQANVMRVDGRLVKSTTLSYSEKFPIILPYGSQFSRLLIRFLHQLTLHGGNALMLRLLRQEYWLPRAKNMIKAIVNHCKSCLLYKQRQRVQIMASLPSDRASLSRPFTVTGVDFAGPFDIKNHAGRGCKITKGYVCVFVCFATKAIHLEVTSSLTTECFLATFARFVARRGCPKRMNSDNGTTFAGASACLYREMFNVMKVCVPLLQK